MKNGEGARQTIPCEFAERAGSAESIKLPISNDPSR
jgi:hypothetical protein